MTKYSFRIKTRSGLTVDHLRIQAADRGEAERRLKQMYHHCEVLECTTANGSWPISHDLGLFEAGEAKKA
ncbi:MAG: hypothetical protein ACREUA_09115 [Burkholderiales bacterium]